MMMDEAEMIEAAISLAVYAHHGQRDKAGAAYILHPLRVMQRMGTAEEMVAAVLHDVVEDGNVDLQRIVDQFGDEIGAAVDHLTRRDEEVYGDFIVRCGQNELARTVKIADLSDNMDLSRLPEITQKDHERFEKYGRALARLQAPTIVEPESQKDVE